MSKPNDKASQPMDPTAREGASPTHAVRNVRNAYALDTLVEEVTAAFGEVFVTYGQPDEWQVIHEAAFGAFDYPHLADVLHDVAADDRVLEVDGRGDGMVYVLITPNRRIRDTRDGFGVAAILEVWREDEPESVQPIVHKVAQARKPAPKKRAPRKTAAKKTVSKGAGE